MAYYAGKMFLTPKHLSTVVKEVSGKTAGEWIDSLVILEAKALLKSSEQSIQEIADELHFANQSFFGKYFKHHTGMSPKEYMLGGLLHTLCSCRGSGKLSDRGSGLCFGTQCERPKQILPESANLFPGFRYEIAP